MKVWLGWVFILVAFCTASAQNCASDETGPAGGSCTCNATMYKSAKTPPQPALQCLTGQMRLNVSKCQLEASKYDSSNLHLNDPTCVGIRQVNAIAVIVVNTSASSLACGNKMTANTTHVTYSNILHIPAKSFGGIYSKSNATYSFSCVYPINLPIALVSALKPVIGGADIPLPGGFGTETVIMSAYTDDAYSKPYTDSSPSLNVEDPLYISVLIPDLDATVLAVKVVRVYATAVNDPNTPVKYELITNGCPSADLGYLVTIKKNGATNEARFQISVFLISDQPFVYLFAEVQICKANCTVDCSSSGSTRGIARDSGASGKVGIGPFVTVTETSGAAERFSWVWTINTLLLSLLGARFL